jgi:hypothetical protein
VVRCEPIIEEESGEKTSEFDVACYFTSLEEDSRNLLDAFVAWKILRSARADEERTAASPLAGRRMPGSRTAPRTQRGAGTARKPARKTGGRKAAGRKRTTAGKPARPTAVGAGKSTERKSWSGKSSRGGSASRGRSGTTARGRGSSPPRSRRPDKKPAGSGGRR